MDRIQKAVAKARAEREGNIGLIPTLTAETSKRKKQVIPFNRSQDAKQARKNIDDKQKWNHQALAYTSTRTQDLDEDVLKEQRVLAGFQYDDRVEAYRQLRTQVLKQFNDNGWNTLAITSAHEQAGKTLTAINLAISISREVNHTVLLIDLDLRSPGIASTLGIDIEYGLVNYLNGEVKLEQVLVNPGYQRMVVLPGKPMGKYSSEILSSPAMKLLVNDIRSRYHNRIIIFDLPPLLKNDDALIFIPEVDATLLVVEDGRTKEEQLQRSLHLLDNSNVLGTVLNKAR